jgi:hypothetical protein
MKKSLKVGIFFIVMVMMLVGCKNVSSPSATMEAYMNAISTKDANVIASLSCPDYAQTAQESLDSFMSVDTTLADLACSELENDGSKALVNCTGNLVASYNNEKTEFDLSILSYQLQKVNGDWLVCGQQ